MSHQNLNVILRWHEDRIQAHLADAQAAQLRSQVESQRTSWISAHTRSLMRRAGSRLVAWGERLECYGYRELSPSR
jgi:hypothetical protein